MDAYEARTGIRLTYPMVAKSSGLSVSTLESIASRESYNATIHTLERLCICLDVTPAELLDMDAEEEN